MTPPPSLGFLILEMVPIRISWQSSDLARLETHPTDADPAQLAQPTSTVGVIPVPTGPATSGVSGGGGDSPLSHPGAIAAVALGAFLFGVVVAGSWVLLYRHRRRKKALALGPVQGSNLPVSEVTETDQNAWPARVELSARRESEPTAELYVDHGHRIMAHELEARMLDGKRTGPQ